MDHDNKHLPFRLLPDGSMEFLTLEAMLTARQHLTAPSAPSPMPSSSSQSHGKKKSSAKTPPRKKAPAVTSKPSSDLQVQRPPLPAESEILERGHSRLLDAIFAAGPDRELSTRELGERFPARVIGENPSQTMLQIRSRLEKAGYAKGLVLDWRQGGFGPDKTMFYKAGPALLAGSPPPSHEDLDGLH